MFFTLAVEENVRELPPLCVLTEASAVYTVCYHEIQEMKLFPLPSFQNTCSKASEELEVIRQSLAKRYTTVHYGVVHTTHITLLTRSDHFLQCKYVWLAKTAAWFFFDNQVPTSDNTTLDHVLLSSYRFQRYNEQTVCKETLPDNPK